MAPVRVARAVSFGPRTAAAAVRRHARRPRSAGQAGQATANGFDIVGAEALRDSYVPRRTRLPLELFVSELDAISYGRSLGWNRLYSDLIRVHTIPGDHRVLLDPNNATVLARQIRQSLDQVR